MKNNSVQNQWLFIDESGKPEVYSAHGENLVYYYNPYYTHGGLQNADYFTYAVFQVFERKNRQWYELVKNKIGKIHDICNKKYYTRSNPL